MLRNEIWGQLNPKELRSTEKPPVWFAACLNHHNEKCGDGVGPVYRVRGVERRVLRPDTSGGTESGVGCRQSCSPSGRRICGGGTMPLLSQARIYGVRQNASRVTAGAERFRYGMRDVSRSRPGSY